MGKKDEVVFEFEEEDEDEQEEIDPRPRKKRSVTKKKSSEATSPAKKAKKMPISDGIKRRLVLDAKAISDLKSKVKELKTEMSSYENEIEYMESEIEKIRSTKETLEEESNKNLAVINALEKKLERTHKDFDGYKNRVKQEIDRKAVMGMKKMVMGVIDIIDNFDRAINEAKRNDHHSEVKKIIEGMESIRRSHAKLLTENNIEMVDPMGEQFDPNVHEAIEVMNDTTFNDNTVIKVDTVGYILEGKVLKPARVIVSKGGRPWPKKEPEKSKKEEEVEELEDLEEFEETSQESR